MPAIFYESIVEAVAGLCPRAAFELDAELIAAFAEAAKKESNAGAAERLGQLLENAEIATRDQIPLCQDTGVAVVFVEQGRDAQIVYPADRPEATLDDAINEGVAKGYSESFLRKSMVADPVFGRVNTNDNTPAVIHHRRVAGAKMKITLMAKGGGCENKSAFKMLKPTAGAAEVRDFILETVKTAGADACPPFVIGVGVGGNFEYACYLAKAALLRSIHSSHSDAQWAQMEKELLDTINSFDIGPSGLKGDTTALAVLIETYPCHIASLPVAVNIECHSHRHKTVTL